MKVVPVYEATFQDRGESCSSTRLPSRIEEKVSPVRGYLPGSRRKLVQYEATFQDRRESCSSTTLPSRIEEKVRRVYMYMKLKLYTGVNYHD